MLDTRTPDATILKMARRVPALTAPLADLTAAHRRWDQRGAAACLHGLEVALCARPTTGRDATETACACDRAIRAELRQEGA